MIAFGILLRLTETQLIIGYALTAIYVIIIVYGGIKLSDSFSKRCGEPTLKECFFGKDPKKDSAVPSSDNVLLKFIDALSEETPEEPGPYSGSEWSSSAPVSSPTESEATSTD